MTKLKVPYYTQIGNDWHPVHGHDWAHCNAASHSMMVEYLKPGSLSEAADRNGMKEAESYYQFHLAKYGKSTNNAAHSRVLQEFFKIDNQFRMDGTLNDIRKQIDSGVPTPVGLIYKAFGHWCCVTGYDENGFFVHDPYGTRMGASDRYRAIGGTHGKDDYYSNGLMSQLFCPNGRDGWYRKILR